MASEYEVVINGHDQCGEGAFWNAVTNRIVWVDILGKLLHQFDPASGVHTSVNVGSHVGTAVPRARGGIVCAVQNGIVAVSEDGRIQSLVEIEADRPQNRFNDGKADPQGRLWAGTMGYDATQPTGTLYRINANLSVHAVLDGIRISNGLDWTADQSRMYYIDSPTHRIDVFDYEPAEGQIANRRMLVETSPDLGLPDGMTLDAEGYLWVAYYGGWGLRRYAPDGSLDREIKLPVAQVTTCAFGGPDYADLYITSAAQRMTRAQLAEQPLAGALFRVRPGVKGRAPFKFAG